MQLNLCSSWFLVLSLAKHAGQYYSRNKILICPYSIYPAVLSPSHLLAKLVQKCNKDLHHPGTEGVGVVVSCLLSILSQDGIEYTTNQRFNPLELILLGLF